jgi:YggT family protein
MMYALGNFILALTRILDIVLHLYLWILVARAVISWIRLDPRNPIVQLLYGLTEPVLRRIRSLLRLSHGQFDFSPVIAILAIWFLTRFLVPTLTRLGNELGGKIP